MSERPVLRRGSFGQDVAAWQQGIGVAADGIFGARTEIATKQWQADHDLEPDGIVGALSWATLPPATERLVSTVRTPVTIASFTDALRGEWPEATRRQAGILWAHLAGETLDGTSCFNFNLGNVKHVRGDGHPYVSLRGVWEGLLVRDEDGDGDVDDADRLMFEQRMIRSGAWAHDPSADHARAVGSTKISLVATPANPTTHFVSYNSIAEGLHAFVQMKRDPHSRYAIAWRYVLAADPEGYAYALGQRGYYTASPTAYAAAMRKKFDAWLKAAPAFPEA